MQAAWPEEKDHIIVGDFNCTPPQIATLLPNFQDRTTGSGSTLNHSGDVTANLYDHVLVRDGQATAEMQGNATVLDVRPVAGSPSAYFSTMSDHLPIVVVLKASKDDD
jgi:endonuclease/exonuclease/phosphatase family metal-dependent hydrolase